MTHVPRGRWARRSAAPPGGRERGSATVELAASLPALVLIVVVALTAVTTVRTQLECVDAAREAARAEARGESGSAAGRRVAPNGASVTLTADGALVRATVRVQVHPVGGLLPGFDVGASAVAAVEPGIEGG
jgi:Flp pilus assembly protein TadG